MGIDAGNNLISSRCPASHHQNQARRRCAATTTAAMLKGTNSHKATTATTNSLGIRWSLVFPARLIAPGTDTVPVHHNLQDPNSKAGNKPQQNQQHGDNDEQPVVRVIGQGITS